MVIRMNDDEWQSNAQWPLECYRGADGKGISTDTHRSAAGAEAVCRILEAEGFGGQGEYFPIKTWYHKVKEK